jgi:capsular polysaccharide transport system permease protein
MLELVVNEGQRQPGQQAQAGAAPQPAAADHATGPPPRPPQPPGARSRWTPTTRAAEIMKVQRDIARRRRKRLILLVTRLAFFVLLPTLLVAYYYFRVATPLYATNTEFVIQKAESGAAAGGGGLAGCSAAPVSPRCRKASRCRATSKAARPCCGWMRTWVPRAFLRPRSTP